MTSPIRTLKLIFDGGGRHRVVSTGRRVNVSLDDLLGPWRQPAPQRVHGAPFEPKWGDCPVCDKATAGVVNKDGWTCGECLTPVLAGGAR